MHTLEEIHIRVTEGTREVLIEHLQANFRNRTDHFPGLLSLHLYCHARYETDLCLQLSWKVLLPVHGSVLALNILAGIREFGSAKHTVWIESSAHKTIN